MKAICTFLPWILFCYGVVVMARTWFKMRRVDRLLDNLRHCQKQLQLALDRQDREAALRWLERFNELHEHASREIDRELKPPITK